MLPEVLAILFYIIGDVWTTRIILSMPEGREHNPIVRLILEKTGFKGLIAVKMIYLSMIVTMYPQGIWFVIGIVLTVWNYNQIRMYNNRMKDIIK